MCSKSALFCIVRTLYIYFGSRRWRIRFWRLESADWSSSPPPPLRPPLIACRFLIYSSQPKSPFRSLQFLPPSLHFAIRTLELRKMERLSTFPKIVSTSSFAIQLSIFLASRLLFLFLLSPKKEKGEIGRKGEEERLSPATTHFSDGALPLLSPPLFFALPE